MARLLGWIMKRLYTDCSWAYSPAAWVVTGGLYYRWTFTAEEFVREGPVLDAGCGRGRLLGHLAQQGWDVIGVDASPQMAQAAQRHLEQKHLKGTVICGDARSLPFADESIGTIINAFPMPYVHEETTWREYLRVLRPGGRWIVVTGPQLDGFHLRMLGWYLFLLIELGLSLGAKRKGTTVPTEFFPVQRRKLVAVGSTCVSVAILEKELPPAK